MYNDYINIKVQLHHKKKSDYLSKETKENFSLENMTSTIIIKK